MHLSRGMEKRLESQDDAFRLSPMPISHYLKTNRSNPVSFSRVSLPSPISPVLQATGTHRRQYSSLFNGLEEDDE